NVDTDDQAISLDGNILTLEDGGTVDLSDYLDNTDNQGISLDGNILTLENGGTVDLSAFMDNVDTDDQAISLDGNILTLEDGGTVDLSDYLDNTDNQGISLDGNILTLEDGGTVDLSDYLDNTDNQGISLDGNIITLENGGTIDLTDFLDNTDDQEISLSGNIITLENGGTIDLSDFLDNTDNQTLSLYGTNLSLENGGTVNLAPVMNPGPIIFATGRHGANELSGTQSTDGYNSTITRVQQGLFDISFPNIGSDNYIIQLTVEDCGGNCPDNGNSGYDDPTIGYIASTISPTGFRVRAGDNDNGAGNLDLADIGFMYTVIQLPATTAAISGPEPSGTNTNDFNLLQLADSNPSVPWQMGFTGPSYDGSFNYEILLDNVPYTLNNINLGDHTVIEHDNGDGTFDYLFTSTSPLPGYNQYRQITADPPAPTPSGSVGSGIGCGCVSFYILP
ncbi:MAG: hypothetical protein AAGA77_26285, partial [Bacteroidota bacterium]